MSKKRNFEFWEYILLAKIAQHSHGPTPLQNALDLGDDSDKILRQNISLKNYPKRIALIFQYFLMQQFFNRALISFIISLCMPRLTTNIERIQVNGSVPGRLPIPKTINYTYSNNIAYQKF